jgi:hypothetical protein
LLFNLSNWLSGGALYRYQRQVNSSQIELRSTLVELKEQNQLLLDTQQQLDQTRTKLQVSQLELEQAQLQFQLTETELSEYKQQLEQLRTKLKQMPIQLEKKNDWQTNINQVTEIIDLKRLPIEDSEALWGFNFSSPQPQNRLTGGAIIFRGWVLGKRARAKSIKFIFNDCLLDEVPVNQPSNWLTNKYPNISAAKNSYFETAISLTNAPTKAELIIQVVLADRTTVSLATCQFQQLVEVAVAS